MDMKVIEADVTKQITNKTVADKYVAAVRKCKAEGMYNKLNKRVVTQSN